MAGAQRGQTIGIVLPHVLLVADADRREIQQRDHAGQHALRVSSRPRKIARHLAAQLWQEAARTACSRQNLARLEISRQRSW